MKKDFIFLLTVMLVYIGAHAQITPTDGTVYVREMALGAKDGSSWANAPTIYKEPLMQKALPKCL